MARLKDPRKHHDLARGRDYGPNGVGLGRWFAMDGPEALNFHWEFGHFERPRVHSFKAGQKKIPLFSIPGVN